MRIAKKKGQLAPWRPHSHHARAREARLSLVLSSLLPVAVTVQPSLRPADLGAWARDLPGPAHPQLKTDQGLSRRCFGRDPRAGPPIPETPSASMDSGRAVPSPAARQRSRRGPRRGPGEAGGGSHLGVSPAGSGGQPTGVSVGVWAHSHLGAGKGLFAWRGHAPSAWVGFRASQANQEAGDHFRRLCPCRNLPDRVVVGSVWMVFVAALWLQMRCQGLGEHRS